MKNKNKTMKEQPQTEQPKKEKLAHEIELEQRPEPQKGEALDLWIKRIGGPNAETVESLNDYKMPDKKKDVPLLIDRNGNVKVNTENIERYFQKELFDKWITEKNPNIEFSQQAGEYNIKKELVRNPENYFQIIGAEFKNGKKIVAEKGFGESIEKWAKELKGEKAEEKPEEKKEKPEKKARKKRAEKPAAAEAKAGKKAEEAKKPEIKKEPTLDERIEAKRKELEEVEQKYNIYYSPALKDLLGLYYEKRLKDVRQELKDLEKGRASKEPGKEKTDAKDYLNHIKETDKLFTEMALTKGKIKRKELKSDEYKKVKAKWQEAFKKTLDMESGFDPRTIDKIIKIWEKERKKKKEGGPFRRAFEKVKKIAKALWDLVVKRIGKEIINEVKKETIKLDLKEVRARLAAMKMGVKQGVGQAVLEKEKARLEKRLKEMRGKKAKKNKAKKNKK